MGVDIKSRAFAVKRYSLSLLIGLVASQSIGTEVLYYIHLLLHTILIYIKDNKVESK